ncbi:hypothetical protein TH25_11140 [Thalassospira profundimaris]|uniref:Uncharacterized protein n=1 Tax=Thalassospira profundimaris TaxID=502049 RepID=A0A367XDF8_9PROT|nr:hypothetical protein [Thalassospira profundimaris]RCK50821.1 hypothetical protein TH25_11140 [Thalassospira profundimaris]
MLVYANHFIMSGQDTEYCVLKAIGGWIKEQLGYGLHPEQLVATGEFPGQKGSSSSYLKIISATDYSPKLFFWKLSVQDQYVKGRQWQTELGLKISSDRLEFSCVLKTDELSALIAKPVIASKPRVITYIFNNIKNANNASFLGSLVGDSIKELKGDLTSYRAFLYEIERSQRDYPIVLVSPTQDGEYLVNCDYLQNSLIGLAQVIKVSENYDRYEMCAELGQKWSAWHGAINVIHTPRNRGFIQGRYFLADEIRGWGEKRQDYVSRILAWVTNDTNAQKLKNRIRFEGVIQAAFRSRIKYAQLHVNSMDSEELKVELNEVYKQVERQEHYFNDIVEENKNLEILLAETQNQASDLSDQVRQKDFQISSLQGLLDNNGKNKTSNHDIDLLFNIACRKDEPTPEECLNALSVKYFSVCEILESATKSAQDSNRFKDGRRLLDMLVRLVTDYREELIKNGDAAARKVFGQNEFAAKESETVMSHLKLKRYRTFNYLGEDVEMFRHLKIGTSDDVSKTIRVHFYWDYSREKIIIGYCGKHLPVSDH